MTAAEVLARELDAVGPRVFTARGYRPGTITHVVLFRYGADVSGEERAEVARRFTALAESEREDGTTYIRSIRAGVQSSGEDAGHGFEMAFVVTFDSEGDRNFYVGEPVVADAAFYDARHAEFKRFAGPFLAPGGTGVLVFDFAAAD